MESIEELSNDEIISNYISMLESYDKCLIVFQDYVKMMAEKEKKIELTKKELIRRKINIEDK